VYSQTNFKINFRGQGNAAFLGDAGNFAYAAVSANIGIPEISHSGTRNVDVCVANISSPGFPEKKVQCFLSGYDFDGLSVKWQGPRVIEVSFSSGRVSRFTNSAFVYPSGPVPEEFHTLLCDGCGSALPSKAEGGAVSSLQ
jgi:hypothetical protein